MFPADHSRTVQIMMLILMFSLLAGMSLVKLCISDGVRVLSPWSAAACCAVTVARRVQEPQRPVTQRPARPSPHSPATSNTHTDIHCMTSVHSQDNPGSGLHKTHSHRAKHQTIFKSACKVCHISHTLQFFFLICSPASCFVRNPVITRCLLKMTSSL